MATFAQSISPNDDTSAGWEALRFFTLSAVFNNLMVAMCAMWAMWTYADFPEDAHRLSILDDDSWPARVARGERLTRDLIMDPYNQLLQEFGMYRSNNWIIFGELIWTVLGLILTFLALTTYVWLTQSKAVAGSLMMFFVPGFFTLLFPLLATLLEWRTRRPNPHESTTFPRAS